MIDAHCHLDLYPNPLSIAEESDRLGIWIISMTNLPSHFKIGYSHLRNFKRVRLAVGMHPLYADRHENELKLFSECLQYTSYVGEIGLDFSNDGIGSKEQQINSFKYVLKEISGKSKIVSLHSRRAEIEVLNYLKEYNIKNAIFHWYTGSISLINNIVRGGFMFSINPAMIRSKSGQEIIRNIPLAHVLTESDGPFIQYKGRLVKSDDIGDVEEFLAKIHNVSRDAISKVIATNFKKLVSGL